jgi:hypothetical protein
METSLETTSQYNQLLAAITIRSRNKITLDPINFASDMPHSLLDRCKQILQMVFDSLKFGSVMLMAIKYIVMDKFFRIIKW